ncbi:hypothetical protein I547_5437 [Mycobacterium kansasii 824]|nr:hypothetical protein I547_5437 [Mycobacterium kansasii 824]
MSGNVIDGRKIPSVIKSCGVIISGVRKVGLPNCANWIFCISKNPVPFPGLPFRTSTFELHAILRKGSAT